MRKLYITCDCGQQMQVPRSAIGKMGQCPSCGEKIPINRDTTSKSPQARASVDATARRKWGGRTKPSLEAKQRFGRAVDLYCAGHYGEALVLFDSLKAEFPDSEQIERARRQCEEARNRGPVNLPEPAEGQIAGDELDENTVRAVRRIAVEKMLNGATDAVQIQAADLVARLAGAFDRTSNAGADSTTAPDPAEPAKESSPGDEEIHTQPGGNGYVDKPAATRQDAMSNPEELEPDPEQ